MCGPRWAPWVTLGVRSTLAGQLRTESMKMKSLHERPVCPSAAIDSPANRGKLPSPERGRLDQEPQCSPVHGSGTVPVRCNPGRES